MGRLNDDQIARLRLLEGLVSKAISLDDAAHDLSHVTQVMKNACWISENEPVNTEAIAMAALCHDLRSRSTAGFSEAERESAALANGLLREIGCPDELIGSIHEMIITSSWEHQLGGGTPTSPEAFVLRDADLLESIGARGTARVFAFAGLHNRPLTFVDGDPHHPERLKTQADGPDPSPFHHFYSKLLHVIDLLVSPRAREEGARRHAFIVEFLSQYEIETAWPIRELN